MSEQRTRNLELTDAEIRILLDLCAKELLREIQHNIMDPRLTSIIQEGVEALAPGAEDHAKDEQSV